MISKSNVKFTDSEERTWLAPKINCVRCDNLLIIIFLKKCIKKQLLDSVFVISEIIKVSVSAISLSLTSTLIIPDISQIPHPIIVYNRASNFYSKPERNARLI